MLTNQQPIQGCLMAVTALKRKTHENVFNILFQDSFKNNFDLYQAFKGNWYLCSHMQL